MNTVLVTDLLNIEEAAFCPNVRLTQVLYSVDDCRANSTSNAVIVRFSHSAKRRNIGLVQEVLCII
jgi:hypothetical protein